MQSVYDEIADYIQLHYLFTDPEDTDYWRDQKYSDTEIRLDVLARLWRRESSFSVDEAGDLFSNTAWNSILIGMRMIPLSDFFRQVDAGKYVAANKAMEENLRKPKRQAAGHAVGEKNPSHYEYLSGTVYRNVESE